MEKKEQVVTAMSALSDELSKSHPGSATAKYVAGTLTNLRHCGGLGFPETMQDFFQHAPVVKLSEGITLNDTENELWDQAFAYTKYCNNVWTASV